MRATGTRRERGAYFTPDWLAVELAKWAIRAADDTVIDPAAGDGSLVVAAAERLRTFGSLNAGSIEGIELHERTAARLRRRLNGASVGIDIQRADFFDTVSRARQRRVVLANPPFVRHHEIPAGLLPKMRAALNGKSHLVGGRASTWAYFLLASTDLLCRGGRLAMVLPTDVLNAEYAQPIVRQLCSQFGSVTLAVIELTAYSGLKTRAVACLADDFGATTPSVSASLARLGPSGLVQLHTPGANDNHGGYTSATALGQLATPENARRLLAELGDDSRLIRLGDCARVTIG
jgi:adenine-specific DNA-methyltransferase